MGVRVQTTRGPCHCVDERCCWRWRQLKLNSSYHLSLLLGFLTPSPTKNKYKGAASVRSAQGHSCDKFIHLQNTHVGLHSCLWLLLGSIVAVEGNSVHENPEALCPYYDRRVMCWRVHLILLSPGSLCIIKTCGGLVSLNMTDGEKTVRLN